MIGIYLIINCVNGKIYIGSSTGIKHRFYTHIWYLNKQKHKNKHLQSAWNFYGADAFHFCVVEECFKENLLETEQKWLNANFENSYNKSPTAGNTLGKPCSEETKIKISIANKGNKWSEESKIKIKGRKHSEETILKMSWANSNPSSETRAKLSAKLKGNQRNRKSEKWPHGCKCKCRECKDKRNALIYAWQASKQNTVEF